MAVDRRDLRKALFAIASEQAGYFSAAQAKAVGYSYQAQAHHVTAGNWTRFERGIFRLTEWLPQPHDELARWVLWSRGQGVISHETALSVHGVGEFESGRVHLSVPQGFTSRDDALLLHVAELDDTDVEQRPGYRLTTVERSLIDLAGTGAEEDQLARAITEAADAGLIILRRLRSRAETIDLRAALQIERALAQAAER